MRSSVLRIAKASRGIQARSYSTTPETTTRPIRHFLSIGDLTPVELVRLVKGAAYYQRILKGGSNLEPFLKGKTVAMLFNKLSTRTRVSTEAAVARMGGHPMFLGKNDIQLGVNETLLDTTKVISSMTSCIVARVGPHSDILELAKHSSVPVINALSNDFHPLQIIADLLTIHQAAPSFSRTGSISFQGLKLAWVGDANNVLFDLIIACVKLGMKISVATPPGYEIPQNMLDHIATHGDSSTLLEQTHSPEEAVKDADFIFTDTWISMGQEEETQKRLEAFAGFQVTNELAERGGAKPDWKFMHCLPRHAEEVSDEVFYSPRSLVFPEAENRLYAALVAIKSFVTDEGVIDRIPIRRVSKK
ncbi:ornithine carbamoyltransferase precursor-like protein [Hypoxylon trugodes]|uniref:ornithine carbamoyltransferase precursor-like protein n=1 Tax=Hypoxylon trugodes TaxID=326681 RepID=UPI00218EFDE3|nr:ornithine carbamoyltransferase precursor-like protein [Hypoxylon trugodes]KAI1388323.1 ornithine carbamoyltransferase precursor-like protein [Hypoxylon trugodes]